jgi:hypothetical protein
MSHTQHAIPQVGRLIPLGRLVATPHALALLEKAKLSTFTIFARQERGDWGDVDIEDAMANEQALIYGGRLMSVYKLEVGTIWAITEADRSVTTLLLPEDY